MASIQSKKSKTGKITYYVVVCFRDQHKWLKAGTLSNARILKREVEAMEESRRLEKLGLGAKDVRVDDFFDEYLNRVKLTSSANTVKRYRAGLSAFVACLKLFHPRVRFVAQITPEVIESFQEKRLESVELKTLADGEKAGNHVHKRLPLPQTVNYEVGVVRSALTWAHERELIASVPTKKVRPLKPKPKRQIRLLSEKECRLLLKTGRQLAKQNPRLAVYFRAFKFLLNTGLRSGDLCNLTWDDVDLETGLIQIRAKENWTPKSYAREFFMNQACLRLLRSVKDREGFVFKDQNTGQLSTDDLRKALIKVAGVAGLDGLTRVHDLRHTFNSLMQMNGVDPATMGKILGHKDIETTMIYTHQTAEHLKKSIEKVGVG